MAGSASDYVDKGAQTIISGLSQHPSSFPPALGHTNTTTPPDEMPSKNLPDLRIPTQQTAESIPATSTAPTNNMHTSPTLLLRRKNRPPLVARISLPASDMDSEGARSPPPTEAVLSPLPAANKLHAGHTPIFPRAMSPQHAKDDSGQSTPEQQEEFLSGPLTLPAIPGDGTEDRIELKVLDAELEKIAREQVLKGAPSSPPSQSAENGGQRSRKGSAEGRRRASADDVVEFVDGVLLKKPRMNMGAPLGRIYSHA